MKTYESYKDSGIQWIGEIPEHWEVKKLGYISEMIVPMRDKPKELDGPIPWLRIEDFEGKYVENSKSNQGVTEDVIKEMNLKVLPIGTVLCSCSCAMGIAAIVTKPLITNQTFIGIVPSRKLDSSFLYYTIQSAKQYLDIISTGAIQTYLSRESFEKLGICNPSISEQTTIANYLDIKTTEIDQIIIDKEALINLYEEEKKALINEAVTNGVKLSGVEPSVAKLKPSGIDWLGDVPEHWEVKKIKHTTYLKARVGWKGLRSDEFLDEGFSYLITGTDIKDGKVDFANAYYIDKVRYDDDPFIQLKINDLLITKDGTIGKLAIVDKLDRPACLNSGVFVLRTLEKKWQVKFLFFILSSNIFKSFIDYTSYGSTILHLYQNVFNEFQFPLPPLEEQTAIVRHIETETTKINDKINLIKQEIVLLKEYRQALIFEAVTGKIRVH